jgi:hypothetical protein
MLDTSKGFRYKRDYETVDLFLEKYDASLGKYVSIRGMPTYRQNQEDFAFAMLDAWPGTDKVHLVKCRIINNKVVEKEVLGTNQPMKPVKPVSKGKMKRRRKK